MKKFFKDYKVHIVWTLICLIIAAIIFCIKAIPNCIAFIFIGLAFHFVYDMLTIIDIRKKRRKDF